MDLSWRETCLCRTIDRYDDDVGTKWDSAEVKRAVRENIFLMCVIECQSHEGTALHADIINALLFYGFVAKIKSLRSLFKRLK